MGTYSEQPNQHSKQLTRLNQISVSPGQYCHHLGEYNLIFNDLQVHNSTLFYYIVSASNMSIVCCSIFQFGTFETISCSLVDLDYRRFKKYQLHVSCLLTCLIIVLSIPLALSVMYFPFRMFFTAA